MAAETNPSQAALNIKYVPDANGLKIIGENVFAELQEVLDVVNKTYLSDMLFPFKVSSKSINDTKIKRFRSGLKSVTSGIPDSDPNFINNTFAIDAMLTAEQIHAPMNDEEGWSHWLCFTRLGNGQFVKTEVSGIHPIMDYEPA